MVHSDLRRKEHCRRIASTGRSRIVRARSGRPAGSGARRCVLRSRCRTVRSRRRSAAAGILQPVTALLDDLAAISDRLAAATASARDHHAELRRTQTALHEALQSVDDSWSQSNLGYHAELYFGEFERPALGQRFDPEWGGVHGLSEGWADRSLDDVQQTVADRAGITVDQFINEVTPRVDEIRQLVSDVCVMLAPIRTMANLDREAQMLDALESFDFAPSVPFSVPGGMSRDSTAIAQGQRAAPHQVVRQRVRVAARTLAAADQGLQAADRLVRQVVGQIRAGVARPYPSGNSSAEEATMLASLLRRFDDAARALRGRQRNRVDFEINDEYDVQDLVHAFLRLHFDDVRPEEWTPSYLGASTRIDFLLKPEGIVVETKMTRDGLTARRLGEELAIDAVRYRAHPDARVLVCFVHDPRKLIANPRGIESDLSQLSDDDLDVVAVIA
jgi:hypothetical protein